MEKRLILAIALSFLVLLSWSALIKKLYHIENKEITAEKSIPLPQETKEPASQDFLKPEISPPSLFNYSQDRLEITFIEPLAAIKEVTFKSHQDYKLVLKYGFLLEGELLFKRENQAQNRVTFVHIDQSKKIIKDFIFSNSNYDIWLELNIQNLSSSPLKFNLPIILGFLDFSPQNIQARYQDVTLATPEKTLYLNAHKAQEFFGVKFLGLRERFFCAIIEPEKDNFTGFVKKMGNVESKVGLRQKEIIVAPSQQWKQRFHIYLGPQDLKIINRINPAWSAIIHFGTFDFISQILLQLLQFLFSLAHSWGLAIILLSLLIYFILYPLTLKQMRSMKEMQALQPQVEELRKAYKENPQRLNKEILELYRQHKVNPFGGCLPLLLQIPIFFSLYPVLMRTVGLKGARFLWIKDLSEPDRLFSLPFPRPFDTFNLLPVLMAIGMFLQQKMSTVPKTSTSTAEQQKIMLIVMPIMFGFIFYSLPSSLVLYWLVNTILMLFYQIRIKKII
jgi:YidC/Oxa1 family membrane protein insertase